MFSLLYNQYKTQINYLFLLIGLGFIIAIFDQFDIELNQYMKKIDSNILLIALIFGFLQSLMLWLYYNAICKNKNIFTSREDSLKAYYYSQITKYIPGKIWGIIYQVTFIKDKTKLVELAWVNIFFSIYYVYTIGIVAICIILKEDSVLVPLAYFTVIGIIGAYCFSSEFLDRVSIKLKFFVKNLGVKFRQLLVYILFSSIALLITYTFYIKTFFVIPWLEAANIFSLFGIAWIGGFLMILFPSGIGAREAIFIYLGQFVSDYSPEFLATVAILIRILQILQDLINAIIINLYCQINKYIDEK